MRRIRQPESQPDLREPVTSPAYSRVVIMAAGNGKRWKNHLGVPKQLAPVKGEPILLRTIRLLKERGITDIWVTVRYKGQYGDLGVQEYVPENNEYDIDRIYASRELAPGIWLYGDCYYTEKAIDTILGDKHDYWFFGRYKMLQRHGKTNREMYAIKVNDFVIQKAKELRDLVVKGTIKQSIAQTLHRYIEGGKIIGTTIRLSRERHRERLYFTEIADDTDDFDTAVQYSNFIKNKQKPPPVKGNKQSGIRILRISESIKGIGGAGRSVYLMMRELEKRGHSVSVTRPNQLNRVHYKTAAILLTYCKATPKVEALAQQINKPLIHYVCDQGALQFYNVKHASLVIFNSKWLQADSQWEGEQMVFHPLISVSDYQTTPGKSIMLISALPEKGLDIFMKLVKRMPEYQFVLTRGRIKQGHQNWEQLKTQRLANLTFINRVDDPRELYSMARIVLMPSRQGVLSNGLQWVEGFGRVAMEAACSGIPTIGSRESLALQECLGEEGLFAGQDDVDEWIEQIKKLDDPIFYQEKSDYYRSLLDRFDYPKQVDELEAKLYAICNRT